MTTEIEIPTPDEMDALVAAKRAEEARRTSLLGQAAQLTTLDGRKRRAEYLLGKAAGIEVTRASLVAALDPGLRAEERADRSSAHDRDALGKLDEIQQELRVEVDAARVEAGVLADARRLRRRARFDPQDPAKDAAIRGTLIQRLARMTPAALVDMAEEAAAVGDLALLGAIEEEADARPGLASGSPSEREAESAIRKAISSFVPETVARARRALEAVERAERELAERRRILAGGRPSGMHSIREGLREHLAQS